VNFLECGTKLALLTAMLKSFPEGGLLPLQILRVGKRERNESKKRLMVHLAGPSGVVSLRSNIVRKRYRDARAVFCEDQFPTYGKTSRFKPANRRSLSSRRQTTPTAPAHGSFPRVFLAGTSPISEWLWHLLSRFFELRYFDRAHLFHYSPKVRFVGRG